MDNKYYTPEIEEFHVGFEYEVNYGENRWVEEKLHSKPQVVTLPYMNLENIRVKHLDKEDIESLGWEFHQQDHSRCLSSFWNKKNNFLRLTLKYKNSIPYVSIYHYEGWETPDMKIKNKSQLKKLLKQLDINGNN
jgi:hypothetical protein